MSTTHPNTMPNTAIKPISKYDLGPAVRISITLEMLALLAQAARSAAKPLPQDQAEEDAADALRNFSVIADQTVAEETASPSPHGTVHGFCL